MTMFFCELINNGIIQARFYREGESAAAVQEGLEMFQWPKGVWRITEEIN